MAACSVLTGGCGELFFLFPLCSCHGYDLLKSLHALSADIPLSCQFVTLFLRLIVIKAFLGYVSHHDFSWFAYYRIAFGLLVLAFYWQKGAWSF
jgi:undecaprenyl pyrophosphate phosphatase UppP